jgi:hypothetical protein
MMRVRAVVAFWVSLPGILTAQVERPRIFPAQRVVSLTAGVRNAMGWFGAQGERYFADERLSVFVGLGYTPRLDRGDPTGPTFAAGVRSYTAGVKHRAFLEVRCLKSWSKPDRLVAEVGCTARGSKADTNSSH